MVEPNKNYIIHNFSYAFISVGKHVMWGTRGIPSVEATIKFYPRLYTVNNLKTNRHPKCSALFLK